MIYSMTKSASAASVAVLILLVWCYLRSASVRQTGLYFEVSHQTMEWQMEDRAGRVRLEDILSISKDGTVQLKSGTYLEGPAPRGDDLEPYLWLYARRPDLFTGKPEHNYGRAGF
jgi:hypothetical protein